jgi:hypothetical protein
MQSGAHDWHEDKENLWTDYLQVFYRCAHPPLTQERSLFLRDHDVFLCVTTFKTMLITDVSRSEIKQEKVSVGDVICGKV